MLYRIYKLRFLTSVRFGKSLSGGVFTSFLSDTLFSALYLGLSETAEADRLLAAVREDRLRFTDAFPFDETDFFIPRPAGITPAQSDMDTDPAQRKLYKRIQYIPSSLFTAWMKGSILPRDLLRAFGETIVSDRVNRREEQPLPYQMAGFRYNPGCGLYVIAAAADSQAMDLMDRGMRMLSASGIGGRVSSGWGHFDLECAEIPDSLRLALEADGNRRQMLLNAAFPLAEEAEAVMPQARYTLVRRGGFTRGQDEKPVKKRTAWLLAAGSTFDRRFNGQIIDAATISPHPVWRYAKAFMMGVPEL